MTTNSAVDVNQAFAAERADQIQAARARRADIDTRIAAGKLISLGGDKYRVDDPGSWDDGEVLVLQDGQILPEHGLDTSRGRAALYSTVPAWHALGNVVPGGVSDIDQVLRLGGIDFQVGLRPVTYRATDDAPTATLADQFVTVREDTGRGLGVVGARYTVMQNRAVFEFLQDLVADHELTWESAGALRGGRKVFVSLRLPDTITIDAGGINDQIIPFIVAVNSHDGSSLYHVVVTPWRPVCGNTERFALRDAHTRWGVRHTRNARDRIAEARRTLGLSMTYYQAFAAEEQVLARTELAIAQFRQVIDQLWEPPDRDAPARTRTNYAKRVDKLVAGYARNTAQLGRTAYAAERAITEYTDWGKTVRSTATLRGNNLAARATLALEGADDELKSRAHRQLLTLVRQ